MSAVITGIGIVSAIGNGVDENLDSLLNCRTGIAPAEILQTSHNVPVGEVRLTNAQLKEDLGLRNNKQYSRTALLGMTAVREALAYSGVNVQKGKRYGLISATSAGGMDLSEKFYAEHIKHNGLDKLKDVVSHDCGSSTEIIARHFGLTDYVATISTACSSSANSIMFADRLLKHKKIDVAVVGGIDPLCKFTVNGFMSLRILDAALCRPFDASRSGLNLGEGAAFIVMQREEDAEVEPLCRIAGYANANDAYHQTAISKDGEGPYLAMLGALDKAGLEPADIDYINVHGTGTENNDLSEGVAMKRLFNGNIPPFSSTKVFTGHTLGACGAIEAVFSALSIKEGVIFPTFNFSQQIDELGISPEKSIKRVNVRNVMSNSFGFGGNVSSIILSKYF